MNNLDFRIINTEEEYLEYIDNLIDFLSLGNSISYNLPNNTHIIHLIEHERFFIKHYSKIFDNNLFKDVMNNSNDERLLLLNLLLGGLIFVKNKKSFNILSNYIGANYNKFEINTFNFHQIELERYCFDSNEILSKQYSSKIIFLMVYYYSYFNSNFIKERFDTFYNLLNKENTLFHINEIVILLTNFKNSHLLFNQLNFNKKTMNYIATLIKQNIETVINRKKEYAFYENYILLDNLNNVEKSKIIKKL